MNRSESIAELVKALAAARPLMAAILKDKKAKIESAKGSYGYNYADLASVIDAYTEPLSAKGLVLLQPVGSKDGGHLVLTTLLAHESGEWISEEYPVAMFQRAQDQGSAITYARRYAAQSFLGLASEDDDGEAASKASPAPRQAARTNTNGTPKPAAAPSVPVPLTPEERDTLVDVARSAKLIEGTDNTALLALCTETLGRQIKSSRDIARAEFAEVMAAVELKAGIGADVEEALA